MIKKIFLSVLLCTVCMLSMAQSHTVTHVVQRGETLESIAEYYKVSCLLYTSPSPRDA